ncbi:hypothetical protein GGE68_005179 [Rhizobium leguminosarum]|nr:hypothetical protein [Rhizobium leguminosarum]
MLVTHDQEEALSISDRIVVMNAGKADQIGSPFEIYNTPATRFVASFVGTLNFIKAKVVDPDANRIQIGDKNIMLKQSAQPTRPAKPSRWRYARKQARSPTPPEAISRSPAKSFQPTSWGRPSAPARMSAATSSPSTCSIARASPRRRPAKPSRCASWRPICWSSATEFDNTAHAKGTAKRRPFHFRPTDLSPIVMQPSRQST